MEVQSKRPLMNVALLKMYAGKSHLIVEKLVISYYLISIMNSVIRFILSSF